MAKEPLFTYKTDKAKGQSLGTVVVRSASFGRRPMVLQDGLLWTAPGERAVGTEFDSEAEAEAAIAATMAHHLATYPTEAVRPFWSDRAQYDTRSNEDVKQEREAERAARMQPLSQPAEGVAP